MEHVEHHEPHRGRLAECAKQWSEGRAKSLHKVTAQRIGPERPKPNDREKDEVNRGHAGAGQNGAGDVAGRIDGLGDVAGCGLEGRGGEADQIEAGHERGQAAEPAIEGRGEVEIGRTLPIDRAGQHWGEGGNEGKRGRGGRDRYGKAGDPLDAAEVQPGEQEHEPAGEDRDGNAGQIPLVDGAGGEDCGDAASRNPAPPIADACQGGEYVAIRAEGVGAGGSDAANPFGGHQDQLGPARGGGVAEQQAEDKERDRGAALAGNPTLPGEEYRNKEQALVAAAHREGSRADPAELRRVRRRCLIDGCGQLAHCGSVSGSSMI